MGGIAPDAEGRWGNVVCWKISGLAGERAMDKSRESKGCRVGDGGEMTKMEVERAAW